MVRFHARPTLNTWSRPYTMAMAMTKKKKTMIPIKKSGRIGPWLVIKMTVAMANMNEAAAKAL